MTVVTLNLADLDGANGFVLAGIDAGDFNGRSVASAGDFNGDGFDDLIIGAFRANPGGEDNAGESYLVFGAAGGFAATLDLSALASGDGSQGFVLTGIDGQDNSGRSVASAGDVNGDGFDDLLIGALQAAPGTNGNAGESYLVFGSAGEFTPTLDLAALAAGDGSAGFVLTGIDANDVSGISVASAGDVNGDGFHDLLIGASSADPHGNNYAGESYLVFGAAGGFAATLDLAALAAGNDSMGFVLTGIDANDESGLSVASAGDVNGDGFDDLLIGASGASPDDEGAAGESYLVFGTDDGFDATLALAALAAGDGSMGFVLTGVDAGDRSGIRVAPAGDVNGDGFDDIIIGASGADPGGSNNAGESYLVFGTAAGFPATLDLAALAAGDGSQGFVLTGIADDDQSGYSVASAGDVNGDGFDDLLIGALQADPETNGNAGETYLVFGAAGGFAPTLDLAALAAGDGSMGFVLAGVDDGDYSGRPVASAGDVNGDGFDDLLIGASGADPNLNGSAGESYVVYGSDFRGEVTHLGDDGDDSLTGTSRSDILIGGLGDDRLDGRGGRRADVMRGAGGDDTLVYDARDRLMDGGSGEDTLELARSTRALDLTSARPGLLQGIEVIDLSQRGNQTLTLDAHSLLGLSDSSNTLRIEGVAGDRVLAGDGWDFVRMVSVDGEAYAEYTQGAATLQVDSDVNRAGIGTNAINTVPLAGLNGATGFVLAGIDGGDNSGRSVASAGDVNGDGFDDLLIGAFGANSAAGESYLVFGAAGGFAPTLDLAAIANGSSGFVLRGIDAGDRSGSSVASAGDVNGDGFDDLLIGAYRADQGDDDDAGESYLVFGAAGGFEASLDLAALGDVNGPSGLVLTGMDMGDFSGRSVASAGDVNGDGFHDLIIGADRADLDSDSATGESFLVFGAAGGFPASLDLATLADGSSGFVLRGIDEGDYSGFSVASAGDVNGDGFDDLLIGAYGADQGVNSNTGKSYLVFGAASGFDATLDLAAIGDVSGPSGFVLRGIDAGDYSGSSLASAGDVNGDGFDDLLIGANGADRGTSSAAGESYLVFGAAGGFDATLDLAAIANGSSGFVLRGIDAVDYSGSSVASAGDVNGDGFDDLLIGANSADPDGIGSAGESYLVFGAAGGFAATLDLAALAAGDGSMGFVLTGIEADDLSGFSVASAGDVNGDGFDDLLIGAPVADPDGNGSAGESYLLYGSDFRGEITHLGGDGDNTVTGTSRSDILIGGLGDDRLDGRGGRRADVMRGAGGDDTLVYDARDRLMDGGSGEDTLELARSTRSLDLTRARPGLLESIEVIDLSQRGNQTLTLDVHSLLRLSDSSNTLRVQGLAGDRVLAGDGWDFVRIVSVDGEAYAEYTQGAATLQVDSDVNRAGIGTNAINTVPLATLNATTGFVLTGNAANDRSGFSVTSAGDVNGDGFDDLLIGAAFAGPGGDSFAGESYLVFGAAGGFNATLDLADLAGGSSGFVLTGIDEIDFSSYSVASAGDVNGDGFGDLLIGASNADQGVYSSTGESYLVFGADGGFDATLDLADLGDVNGPPGFVLRGIDAGDYSGRSVASAGDVNGDGFDDLLIGASNASPNNQTSAGESYLVFGAADGFDATLDLADLGDVNGPSGFVLRGIDAYDFSGRSVASAGDLNGDGFDDLLIGARGADRGSNGNAGESYLVFGAADGFDATLDLAAIADGSSGFVLRGIGAFDYSGSSVASAGDVNGDGFHDLLIGARGANNNAGESYLVFGAAGGFDATLDLADLGDVNGPLGFVLTGIEANDRSGYSVTSAGDVNGDGFDDLLIGARGANGNAGESYLVFGAADGFDATLDLADLANGDGSSGFVLTGIDAGDYSGISASSAGDVNGDGFDDLLIGADRAGPGDKNSAGESYLLYGSDFRGEITHLGGDGDNTLTGTSRSDILIGGLGDDRLDGRGGRRADVMKGAAGDDTLVYDARDRLIDGGSGEDTLELSRSTRRVDCTDAPVGLLESIEVIDFSQRGGHTLTVDLGTILRLSDSSNTLRVQGLTGDRVLAGDGWDFVRIVSVDGEAYAEYTQGAATLQVDSDVNRAGIGTSAINTVPLASLNGANGFLLTGIDGGDLSGHSVASAGDVNGDGFDDLLISAYDADPDVNDAAGESYLVFGAAGGFATTLDLAVLAAGDGSSGFVLTGIDALDRSGVSVASAGDVNGDGFHDLIIGAPGADPEDNSDAGESYLVFGAAGGFDATLDLAALAAGDGSMGFVLTGIDAGDQSGYSVASAGDVNGDGFDDLIIGAPDADRDANSSAGESYLVFGAASGFAPTLDLAALANGNGSSGFVLTGIDEPDYSGLSVASAGDVNGDGFDDLLIGAPNANNDAGESYLVFGAASGFDATLDLANLGDVNGPSGFVLRGIDAFDYSGLSVASAGDVNGDGFDDLLIGAIDANPGGKDSAGESYLVFGAAGGFAPTLDLAALATGNGSSGFVLTGIDERDYSGVSVASAGDVNGDGFDDIIIGASGATPGGEGQAGESYLVFGAASGFAPTLELAALAAGDGSMGFVLTGIDASDSSGHPVASAGDVNGDGFDDLLIGASGADPDGRDYAGESYLLYGSDFRGEITHLGGDGDNTLTGTSRSDILIGGLGDDELNAGSGNDVVKGGAGNDTLIGGRGADRLFGGSGNDLFVVDASDQVIEDSASGVDTVITRASYTLGRHLENLTLEGSASNRVLTGNALDNAITGNRRNDTLDGLAGDDTLDGGRGADTLRGGAGDDILVFDSLNRVIDGGTGDDDTLLAAGSGTTLDFSRLDIERFGGIERIQLSGGGDDVLNLSELDVLELSDTTNQLIVDGDAGDTVNSLTSNGLGWTDAGLVDLDGVDYQSFTASGATLLVNVSVGGLGIELL